MKNNILTPIEAGKICNVSYNTIKRWIKTGKLDAHVTPGGHYKIMKKDLFLLMKKHKIPISGEIEVTHKQILIVDDDKHVRDSIAKYLRLNGQNFTVSTSSDGLETASLISRLVPDIIILDLMMPRMDGFLVCKMIKANPLIKDIYIMVLTGFATEENKQKALAAGADDIFEKPIEPEILLKEINKVILYTRS